MMKNISLYNNTHAVGLGRRFFSSVSSSKKNFDMKTKLLHKDYAAKLYQNNGDQYEYLRDEVGSLLVDRVNDIAMDFDVGLDFGCNTGNCWSKMLELANSDYADDDDDFEPVGGVKKFIQVDPSSEMIKAAKLRASKYENKNLETEFHVCELENIQRVVPRGSCDLVLSNLSLHWANNVTNTIRMASETLRPDGVFLGSMFCGDTLFELRTALAIAEQEREGGISPHISPMLEPSSACGVLTSAGLNLTTVDTANIEVEFENAFTCMEHLSAMGESNGLRQRRYSTSKDTMLSAAAIYQTLFGDPKTGRVPATFQVLFMIGWKPSETQQKPKPRGSHQASIGDLSKILTETKTKT